jgi:hypothetical protein
MVAIIKANPRRLDSDQAVLVQIRQDPKSRPVASTSTGFRLREVGQ